MTIKNLKFEGRGGGGGGAEAESVAMGFQLVNMNSAS